MDSIEQWWGKRSDFALTPAEIEKYQKTLRGLRGLQIFSEILSGFGPLIGALFWMMASDRVQSVPWFIGGLAFGMLGVVLEGAFGRWIERAPNRWPVSHPAWSLAIREKITHAQALPKGKRVSKGMARAVDETLTKELKENWQYRREFWEVLNTTLDQALDDAPSVLSHQV